MATAPRRPGSDTRAQILAVALELFTRHGYEGTSTRDLAEALGVTKAALYYHFANKEAIILALVQERRTEIDELLTWVKAQPPGPHLLRQAALRWVETASPTRLDGMRFAQANGPTMRKLAADGNDIRAWLGEVVDHVLPAGASTHDRLVARMAFDSLAATLAATQGHDVDDRDILHAARTVTAALTP